jgi:hypothetical protein
MLAAPGDAGNRPIHGRDAEGHLVVPDGRRAFEVSRTWEQLGNNCARILENRGSRTNQKTRRVNKLENLALSAKPPSPVQIRAAPSISLRKLQRLSLRGTIARLIIVPKCSRLAAGTNHDASATRDVRVGSRLRRPLD